MYNDVINTLIELKENETIGTSTHCTCHDQILKQEKLIRICSESSLASQTDQVKLIIFNFEIGLQDLLLEDELPINVEKLITQSYTSIINVTNGLNKTIKLLKVNSPKSNQIQTNNLADNNFRYSNKFNTNKRNVNKLTSLNIVDSQSNKICDNYLHGKCNTANCNLKHMIPSCSKCNKNGHINDYCYEAINSSNYSTSLFYTNSTIVKRDLNCFIDTGAVSSFLPNVFKADQLSYKKFTGVNCNPIISVSHNIDILQNPLRLRNNLSSHPINFIKDKLPNNFDSCDPQLNSKSDINMAYLSKSFEEINTPTARNSVSPSEIVRGRNISVPIMPQSTLNSNQVRQNTIRTAKKHRQPYNHS
ncbi:hypothetical protein A3Q56_01900 [Intoshia linei]|uniref:C3H1-type domain-containing protein n=1 Tax=Intoshia linei TaxID=1819745 RepID=A0A177B9K4_9BILA|nr:hypothetical protein A3Q56_01900 [Intoshia linei]